MKITWPVMIEVDGVSRAATATVLLDDLTAPPAPAPAPVPPPPPPPPPAPVPAPPPPAPAPPPATAARLPAKPRFFHTAQLAGPADWFIPQDLPPSLPWTLFDNAQRDIARSMQGVEAAVYRKLHVWGQPSGLSDLTTAFVDGKFVKVWPRFGDNPDDIKAALATYPMRAGERGLAITTPYTTYHGHSRVLEDGTLGSDRAPLYVGIEWRGNMVYLFRDGSVQIPFRVPIESYCHDFTFHEPRAAKIFFAVDTGVGKLLKVDRNTTPPTTTVFAEGLGIASSCRSFGGSIYVAETGFLGKIWKIDPETGAKSVLRNLPNVFWLDYTSDGHLVAMTSDRRLFKVDTMTGEVGPNLLPQEIVSPQLWVTVSVDRAGTFGEKDGMSAISSHGAGNVDYWRVNTSKGLQGRNMFGVGAALVGVGITESTGHYPWVAEHHPDEALLLAQGFSQDMPALIVAKHPASVWAPQGVTNDALLKAGADVLWRGAGPGTKLGIVPSFTCQMNLYGGSHIGIDGDHIAEMGVQAAAQYVRDGMGGIFPRPFIMGDDMKSLLYYLFRNSQRFLREGKPLLDAVLAADFGVALPPIAQALPIGDGSQWFLEAAVAGSNLVIQGYRPDFPESPPSDLVARIVVDRGMPSEWASVNLVSPWKVPTPFVGGQHSLFVEPVSGTGVFWGRATTTG